MLQHFHIAVYLHLGLALPWSGRTTHGFMKSLRLSTRKVAFKMSQMYVLPYASFPKQGVYQGEVQVNKFSVRLVVNSTILVAITYMPRFFTIAYLKVCVYRRSSLAYSSFQKTNRQHSCHSG